MYQVTETVFKNNRHVKAPPLERLEFYCCLIFLCIPLRQNDEYSLSHQLWLAVCVYNQQGAPEYADSRQHLKESHAEEEQKESGDCEKVSLGRGSQIRGMRCVGFQDKQFQRN